MAITSAEDYAARHAALVAGLAQVIDAHVAASDKGVARAAIAPLVAALAPAELEPAAEPEPEPAADAVADPVPAAGDATPAGDPSPATADNTTE